MNLSCENMNIKLFSAPCRSRDCLVRLKLESAPRRRMERQLPTPNRQRNISNALTSKSIPIDWAQWNHPGQCCDREPPRISSPAYPVISDGEQKTRKKVKRNNYWPINCNGHNHQHHQFGLHYRLSFRQFPLHPSSQYLPRVIQLFRIFVHQQIKITFS